MTHLATKYRNFIQVKHSKYLGEIIGNTGKERMANKTRAEKLRKAYTITWNMYNKKSLSTKAKLRHYHTVTLPKALYAIETSSLTIYIAWFLFNAWW